MLNFITIKHLILIALISFSTFFIFFERVEAELLDIQPNRPGIESDVRTFQDIAREEELEKMRGEKATIPLPLEERPSLDSVIESHRFILNKLDVQGITLLDMEKVAQLRKKYEGKTVSVGDIYEFISQINKLYADEGYFTCLAFLPRQKIDSGIVTVNVIEGKLSDAVISGNDYTDSSFILKQLDLPLDEVPKLKDLNDKLGVFNTLREVQLNADFAPGKEVGTTELNVDVEEKKRFTARLSHDNYAPSANSSSQHSFYVKNRSLLGYLDPLIVGGKVGGGSYSYYLNYHFPLVSRGTLTGTYSSSHNKVINGAPASLGISGDSHYTNLTYTHLLKAWNPYLLQMRFGVDKLNTKNYVGQVLTEADVYRYLLGFDFASIGQSDEFFISALLSHVDHDEEGFTGVSKMDLTRTNIAASYKYHLPSFFYAALKGRMQLSDSIRVPSSEQWSIGGRDSIGSLELGAVSGDEGWDARLNIGWRKPNLVNVFDYLDFSLFYENAWVKTDRDLALDTYKFKDWGIQISTSIGGMLKISLMWVIGSNMPSQLDEENKLWMEFAFQF